MCVCLFGRNHLSRLPSLGAVAAVAAMALIRVEVQMESKKEPFAPFCVIMKLSYKGSPNKGGAHPWDDLVKNQEGTIARQ